MCTQEITSPTTRAAAAKEGTKQLGPDGLSQFEELSRREAARTAILYVFDLIEHMARIYETILFLSARPRWRACCATPSSNQSRSLAFGHEVDGGDSPRKQAKPRS
jgi:hypothetical protein